MSARRRRHAEEGEFCIPGLGDRNYRPGSSYQRSDSVASSETSSVVSSASSVRPSTAPVLVDRRKYVTRSANSGGAADSTQMSSLFCDPPTPINPVKEPVFEEDTVDSGGLTATPFFTKDTGVVLIKGGTVVNSDGSSNVDVLIEDGKITAVDEELDIPENATVINATDKLVLPGGIDPQTHFLQAVDGKDELVDDFESGTHAALAGGTTLVMDMVIPDKEGSLLEAFSAWKETAEEKSCCDFALCMAIPAVTDQTLGEMEVLVKEHGVTLFKVFMSFKDGLQIDPKDMMNVFKKAKELGAVVLVHAENGDMIAENCKDLQAQGVSGPEGHLLAHSEEVEEEAVRRACLLAKQVNVPICISNPTSTAALEVIKEFKDKGAVIVVEPNIASLCLDGSHYYNSCYNHAANFITSPPLRDDDQTKEELLAALLNGTFDMVSSGHCARDRADAYGVFTDIPEGVIGTEERMSLLYQSGVESGKMELPQYVNVTSTAAAKLLNIFPRKGCIAVGSDADIVILNPAANHTISHKSHHSNANFNIYEDTTVAALPEFVLTAGKIVVAEFQTNPSAGSASYVECSPYPAVYENISEGKEPTKVEREQISVDAVDGTNGHCQNGFGLTTPRGFRGQQVLNKQLGIYQRPLSAHGVRNQQDSTFSLNG